MELTATRSIALPRRLAARFDGPAVAAWTLAFALVAYLALRGGGYDTIVRSEVGIAIWWIVLLAAAAGVLPARVRLSGVVVVGLLGAFMVWTAFGATWSESVERTVVELGRVSAYLGILVLAIVLQGSTAARHTVNGVACAIGLVAVLAVLSRLQPQWFPANDHFAFLHETSARKLSFPLNYWNGLAAFAAMGVPLLLAVAVGARTLVGQAVAAATVPVTIVCVAMTVSRGGALAVAVGVLAFLVLAPRRVHAAATLTVAGAAVAILLAAVGGREALDSGLPSAAAQAEGREVLWLAIIACLGVALLQVSFGLIARHVERPRWMAVGRRELALGACALLLLGGVVGVAAGVPGEARQQWREFTAPVGVVTAASENTVFDRLSAANGNGRFEFWKASLDANATDPLRGIGPGTFELWWSRHATSPGFVRDAHTLWFETLAETGVVGLALIGGLFAWVLGVAVLRLLRAPARLRLWIAGATAALLAYMTSAALEWVWELAAITIAALALIAVIVAGRDDRAAGGRDDDEGAADGRDGSAGRAGGGLRLAGSWPARIGLVLLSLGAIVAIALPLAGALAMRDSRAAAADGQLAAALEGARTAERVQPYAATPHLQRALILEEAGAIDQAAAAVRTATAEEPTNWRAWVTLARLEVRLKAYPEALAAFERARALNPTSDLFRTP